MPNKGYDFKKLQKVILQTEEELNKTIEKLHKVLNEKNEIKKYIHSRKQKLKYLNKIKQERFEDV